MSLIKPTAAFLLLFYSCSNGQKDKAPPEKLIIEKPIINVAKEIESLDKSPIDIAWYPQNYPLEKFKKAIQQPVAIRLIYSRPHLQGRTFGKDVAVPDTLWRMGANENNEIEFFKDVFIANKKLTKGKYIVFCMPHKDNWDIFFSQDINTWGLQLDTTKAIIKANVPVQKNNDIVESLTMQFENADKNAVLKVYWGDAIIKLPIML